jgi:segregation and condensation protein B
MSEPTPLHPEPGAAPSSEARRALEAIVLVSSDPVSSQELAQLLELSVDAVDALCAELGESYIAAGHGFRLVRVAGGWRYQTDPDLHAYVERYAMEGQSVRLSSAALETLAIVAYKQPVSRAQVSAIRGVNVDAVLRTLEQRGYVHEVGREAGVGQAILFGTTSFFLERLGLDSPDELPSLGEFVPAAEVVEALEQTLKVEVAPEPVPEGSSAEPGTSDEPTAESA